MIRRIKLSILIVVPLVMLLFLLQNTESVDTTFLFISVSMSQAVLLLVTLLIGFILGIIAGMSFAKPRSKPETKPDDNQGDKK